jgi:hydroxymethylglutaryl-CoA lyase
MEAVRLVEVGARDGLQNEPPVLPVDVRLDLIGRLADAGLRTIEAGAFVSPRWVPQMANSTEVFRRLPALHDVTYTALVPNLHGLDSAIDAGCREVAVFAAASEAFSQRNINCSIAESLERFESVLTRAKEGGVSVRGYVSCVLGCPFTGAVPVEDVVSVAQRLYSMGCYEISLGDTIGVGTPDRARALIRACAAEVPIAHLAGHFHDTYGMAVANVMAALDEGIRTFDSSVSGLGGCPHSPGSTGNVATEELVFLCDGLGLYTGVDLAALRVAGEFIDDVLQKPSASRVGRAMSSGGKRYWKH